MIDYRELANEMIEEHGRKIKVSFDGSHETETIYGIYRLAETVATGEGYQVLQEGEFIDILAEYKPRISRNISRFNFLNRSFMCESVSQVSPEMIRVYLVEGVPQT